MKNILYLGLLLLFIGSCATKNPISKKENYNKENVVRIANDSLEYEIIIMDNEFYNYLNTVVKPMSFYTIDYLEGRNTLYVTLWNDRVRVGYKPLLYENIIDYQNDVHYGLEVNFKLYTYFKFVEKEYGEKFY